MGRTTMTWLLWWAACGPGAPSSPPPAPLPEVAAPVPEPPPREPVRETVRLVGVGDVLPHRRVKATARAHGWATVFADVAPVVQQADIGFANLESPVAPDHHQGIHGEVFNAPADLLDGLAAAGFDVLSMANNHAYDQGPLGMVETWTRVKSAGMLPVGAGPNCDAAKAVVVRRVGERTVGFLAASDLVNIDGNGQDDAPCVFWAGPECSEDCGPDRDAIHFSLDADRLVAAVRAAADDVDVLVMSFHWGDEYRTTPLPEYPRIAEVLTDAGVDILLGHHPHVLQPIVQRTTRRGTPAVIAYSLGNFVSDMGSRVDPATAPIERGHTRDGVALEVTMTFVDGVLTELVPHPIPLWTENNRLVQGDATERVVVRRVDTLDEPLASQRRAAIQAVLHPELLATP